MRGRVRLTPYYLSTGEKLLLGIRASAREGTDYIHLASDAVSVPVSVWHGSSSVETLSDMFSIVSFSSRIKVKETPTGIKQQLAPPKTLQPKQHHHSL